MFYHEYRTPEYVEHRAMLGPEPEFAFDFVCRDGSRGFTEYLQHIGVWIVYVERKV